MADSGKSSSPLSRWSERKARARKGEAPEDDDETKPAATDEADGGKAADGGDENADLSDTELLEKFDLPDPEKIRTEKGLAGFFGQGVPDRLRQLALRRLWRINPLFAAVDDMVEYGEDYTDAATVVEGLKSAYEVGKGYMQKIEEKSGDSPENEGEFIENEEESPESGGQDESPELPESAENQGSPADGEENPDNGEGQAENEAETAAPPPPAPRRQQFTKKG